MIVLVLDGMATISLVSFVAGAALSMLSSVVGSSMRAVMGLIGAVVDLMMRAAMGLMVRAVVGSMRAVAVLMMRGFVGLMVRVVVGSKGSVVGMVFSIRDNLFLTWVSSARIAMISPSNVRDLAKVPLAFISMYFCCAMMHRSPAVNVKLPSRYRSSLLPMYLQNSLHGTASSPLNNMSTGSLTEAPAASIRLTFSVKYAVIFSTSPLTPMA
jgi:hypothetical protein